MAIKKEKACNRRQTIDANLNATIVIIIPKIKKNTRVLSYSVIFCNEFCNVRSNFLTNIKPLPELQIEGMGDMKGRY